MRCSRGLLWRKPELLQEPEIVEASPAFDDLAVDDPEYVDATQHDVLSRRPLTHHRAVVSAVGNEVFGDEIAFSDHLLDVASPVGKGAPDDLSCFAPAFRSLRDTRERRVVADKLWIEIPIDGRQVTVAEQGGDELLDNLLVAAGDSHVAMVDRPRTSLHPSKVGCFSAGAGGMMLVCQPAARLSDTLTISYAAAPWDYVVLHFKLS
jgi:hypothetical protein